MRRKALLISLFHAALLGAATFTWVGTTSLMNTGTNWNPAGVPAPGDILIFPSGPAASVVNDIPGTYAVGNITIAQAYTFTMNPFAIPATSAPTLAFGTSTGTNINLSGVTLNTGGIWTITSSIGGNTITSPMSGPGNITLNSGLLILNGANTYTGVTTIATGATIRAGTTTALSPSTALVIGSGGILDLDGNNNTIGGLAGNPATTAPVQPASSVTLGAATLTISQGNATYPFYGVISGSGNVAITGGTTSLMGTNTYTGSTSIQSGATLNTLNLGSTTALDFSSGGGKIVFLSSLSSAVPITMSGPAMIATNGFNINLSGTFTGTNPLYKIGLGTLTLSGSNATGPYYIEGGTLNVNSSTIGTLPLTFQTYGGILQTEDSLSIVQTVTLLTPGTIDTKANTVVMSNQISGAGDFSKSGTGTLTLSGMNTYSGRTIIQQGTLNIPSINYSSSGSQLLFSGTGTGIFQTGSAYSPLSSSIIFMKNGTVDTNGFNSTFSGVVAGPSSSTFTKSGTGTLTLSGANTYTGPTVVSAGTLQAGVAQVTSTNSCSGLTGVSSGAFGVGSNITVALGATLDFQTFANTVGVLSNTGTVKTAATVSATSYSQASDLILDFPTSSQTPFGNIVTTGAISLSGSLTVTDTGNYIPTAATEIVLLQSTGTGKQLSGAFSSTTLAPQFSSVGKVQYDYSENKVLIGTSTCNGDWQTAGSGNWADIANWVGGCAPGVGSMALDHDAATFPDVGAGSFTATLATTGGGAAQSVTLHDITFNAATTVYTIQQFDSSSKIFLDKASTGSSKPRISKAGAAGATINAPIVLNTDSRIYLSSGTLTLGASTTITSSASTLYISEGATAGTLVHTGSMTPSAIVMEGGTIQNNGTVNPSTTLTIAGLQGILSPLTLTNTSIMTAGTSLTIGGAGGATNITNTGTMSSVGAFTMNSGTVANNSSGIMNAAAGQTFTISGGTLTNANGAFLGLSTANLTLSGGTLSSSDQVLANNYTQGSSGALSLNFPTNMETPAGSISAAGALSLNGSLSVLDTGNFMPISGTELILLQSSGMGKLLSGTFSSTTLAPQFSQGEIHYDSSENMVILGFSTCNGDWQTAGNGNWANTANWVGGCAPGVGSSAADHDVATFPNVAASTVTATLATSGGGAAQSVTLHDIIFNAATTVYTIQQFDASSQIILDKALVGSSKPRINMASVAGATINAPVVLNTDSRIYLTSGTLTLGASATVTSAGSTLYISEGTTTGALINNGSMTPLAIIMEGGTIQNNGTVNPSTTLTIAALQGILNPLSVTNSGTMHAGTIFTIGGSGGSTVVANTGTMSSAGAFTISSGTVTNNSSGIMNAASGQTFTISGGSLTNNSGAVLGLSTANLIFSGGSLTNSGQILANDYTQSGSSTLQINVTDISTFGSIAASGTGTLGGSLIVNAQPNFSMKDGETINLLTAADGLSLTTFSTESFQNFPSSVIPSIVYLPGAVQLDIRQTIAAHTNGGSTQIVFTSVNQHNALITQKSYQMRNRIQLPGSQQSGSEQNDQLSFSDSGLVSANNELDIGKLTQSTEVQQKQSQLRGKIEESREMPWNIYAGPVASFGNVETVADQIGVNYTSVGGLAGFDYVIPDSEEQRFRSGIGAIVEYRTKTMHAKDNWGTSTIDKLHGSIYGTIIPKVIPNLAFDAILGVAHNWDSMKRNAGIGKQLTASANTNEQIYDCLFDVEYTFYPYSENGQKTFSITPLANIQYVVDYIDGYTEHGAGIYDLKVDSQTPESLTTTLGARIDYLYVNSYFSLRTELDAGWQYQYLNVAQTIGFNAFNITSAPTFVTTIAPGRSSLLLGVDLLATFSKGWQLEGTVNYQLNTLFYDLFFYLGVGKEF